MCPNKNQPVATGIEMDEASFANVPLSDSILQCPACGAVHNWDKKDAFLAGE